VVLEIRRDPRARRRVYLNRPPFRLGLRSDAIGFALATPPIDCNARASQREPFNGLIETTARRLS
jgi:hypothetical protein